MDATSLAQSGWTLVSAALVLFMQAGFCCVEAGSVRHKNSINVALKNIIDFCASFAVFFLVGYALMFNDTINGWIGQPVFALSNLGNEDMLGFLFQATFCSTAVTIVSGGIAERCRFLPYLIMSIVLAIAIYPIFGHWVWGGGWLADMGFMDFAGSSVVHMVGAGVALAGIQVLGARSGRFDHDGKAHRIPASNMPLVAIGVVVLTFGWIGFNGGSADLGIDTPTIVTNTLIAACFGGLMALLATWAYGGLAAVDVVLNGVLGGLVAITACANVVSPQAAVIIGMAGGLAVPVGCWLLEKAHLDDAVGAIPVHGLAGIVGIVLTPVFMMPEALAALEEDGLIPTRTSLVGVQALGAAVCCAWSYGTGLILWKSIAIITQLRIGPFEEQVGMNYSEHRVSSTVQDLTTAVALVTRGEDSAAHKLIDNAGSGETADLASALAEMLRTSGGQQKQVAALRESLSRTEADLRERFRGADDHNRACENLLGETIRSLGNLKQFLDTHSDLHDRFPIFRDLVASLQDRLDRLHDLVPRSAQSWKAIEMSANDVQRLANNFGRSA